MNPLYIYSAIYVIFAIILIWLVTLIMIEKKKILKFMPFFIAGLVFCFSSAFTFYGVFMSSAWFFIEFLGLAAIIGIFIILRREK